MSSSILLDRLSGVRQLNRDAWVACCPSHQDRRPSLSVREGCNGVVLVHCFAGCDTRDVVASVGLSMRDLFPSSGRHRPNQNCSGARRWRPSAVDLLSALNLELQVVLVLATDFLEKRSIDDLAWRRLATAANRMARGCNHVN